jgi:hypothetical protein
MLDLNSNHKFYENSCANLPYCRTFYQNLESSLVLRQPVVLTFSELINNSCSRPYCLCF